MLDWLCGFELTISLQFEVDLQVSNCLGSNQLAWLNEKSKLKGKVLELLSPFISLQVHDETASKKENVSSQ